MKKRKKISQGGKEPIKKIKTEISEYYTMVQQYG